MWHEMFVPPIRAFHLKRRLLQYRRAWSVQETLRRLPIGTGPEQVRVTLSSSADEVTTGARFRISHCPRTTEWGRCPRCEAMRDDGYQEGVHYRDMYIRVCEVVYEAYV